jgi:dipeptidyl aminopeptidase/acylaminoacyl peptidase
MVADWSPDGERLLIVSEGGRPTVGPPGPDELSVSSPDGRHTRHLMQGRMFVRPTFSPDGTRIAYLGCDPVDLRHALIIIDADGSNPRRVMDLKGLVADRICWSPDGSRLAVSRLSGLREVSSPQVALVEVVAADGTDRRRLELPFAFNEISELNWR